MNEDAKSKFNILKEYTVRFRAIDGGMISIPIVGATDKDHAAELAKQYARELYGQRGASELTFLRVMQPDDVVLYLPAVAECAADTHVSKEGAA